MRQCWGSLESTLTLRISSAIQSKTNSTHSGRIFEIVRCLDILASLSNYISVNSLFISLNDKRIESVLSEAISGDRHHLTVTYLLKDQSLLIDWFEFLTVDSNPSIESIRQLNYPEDNRLNAMIFLNSCKQILVGVNDQVSTVTLKGFVLYSKGGIIEISNFSSSHNQKINPVIARLSDSRVLCVSARVTVDRYHFQWPANVEV